MVFEKPEEPKKEKVIFSEETRLKTLLVSEKFQDLERNVEKGYQYLMLLQPVLGEGFLWSLDSEDPLRVDMDKYFSEFTDGDNLEETYNKLGLKIVTLHEYFFGYGYSDDENTKFNVEQAKQNFENFQKPLETFVNAMDSVIKKVEPKINGSVDYCLGLHYETWQRNMDEIDSGRYERRRADLWRNLTKDR